jgi:hypothetical protein
VHASNDDQRPSNHAVKDAGHGSGTWYFFNAVGGDLSSCTVPDELALHFRLWLCKKITEELVSVSISSTVSRVTKNAFKLVL